MTAAVRAAPPPAGAREPGEGTAWALALDAVARDGVRLPGPLPALEAVGAARVILAPPASPAVRAWALRARRSLGALAAYLPVVGTAAVRAPGVVDCLLAPDATTAVAGLRAVAGSRRELRLLAEVVAGVATGVLAPQPRWLLAAQQVRSHLVDTWAVQGLDAALSGLHPAVDWDGSVLSAGAAPDAAAPLGAAGLWLVPTAFADGPHLWRRPGTARPAVVTYPVHGHPSLAAGGAPAAWSWLPEQAPTERLVPLLGVTRMSILQVLHEGDRSTGELARAVGIATSSASEHAAVLRRAGIVSAAREGRHVRHGLTPLGRHLYDATA